MAAIMLTRTAVPKESGASVRGWEIDYEGQLIATYAEEADGWLRQVSASRLDHYVRSSGKARVPTSFSCFAAMRDSYLQGAVAWEADRNATRLSFG